MGGRDYLCSERSTEGYDRYRMAMFSEAIVTCLAWVTICCSRDGGRRSVVYMRVAGVSKLED